MVTLETPWNRSPLSHDHLMITSSQKMHLELLTLQGFFNLRGAGRWSCCCSNFSLMLLCNLPWFHGSSTTSHNSLLVVFILIKQGWFVKHPAEMVPLNTICTNLFRSMTSVSRCVCLQRQMRLQVKACSFIHPGVQWIEAPCSSHISHLFLHRFLPSG